MEQSPAFVTIVTPEYLAYANTLHASLRKAMPEARLYIVYVSSKEPPPERDASLRFIALSELIDAPALDRMAFYYKPSELCWALKPRAFDHIFTRCGETACVYLDSDILVLGSFDPVWRALESADIALTPHLLDPARADIARDHEIRALRWGTFNLGFVALRQSERTAAFLRWWRTRLDHHSLNNERGLNGDQLWVNLVPTYFPEAAVALRHPGLNVGYWNLHERDLSWDSRAERFLACGEPLVFFHYSHWDIDFPERASVYDRCEGRSRDATDAIARVGRLYRDLLLASGYTPTRDGASEFARFADGRPIALDMRRLFYDMVLADAVPPAFGSPFDHSAWFTRQIRLRRRAARARRVREWIRRRLRLSG